MPITQDTEPNRWSSTLEKKLQQLLNLLRAMRGARTLDYSRCSVSCVLLVAHGISLGGKNEVKLAIQNLNEVLPWLQVLISAAKISPCPHRLPITCRSQAVD